MALETMASLADRFLCLLTSKSPSPSPSFPTLKPIPGPLQLQCTSSISSNISHHQSMTTKVFTADDDDVINRVAYPSLTNANLVFFKSGYYNVEVVPKDDESEDQLVNDFKRSCLKAGVLQESRRRRFFESSQDKRKRKTKEAAKKNRKRRPNPKSKPHSTPENHKNRDSFRAVEEGDHWELPPEDIMIPYTNGS